MSFKSSIMLRLCRASAARHTILSTNVNDSQCPQYCARGSSPCPESCPSFFCLPFSFCRFLMKFQMWNLANMMYIEPWRAKSTATAIPIKPSFIPSFCFQRVSDSLSGFFCCKKAGAYLVLIDQKWGSHHCTTSMQQWRLKVVASSFLKQQAPGLRHHLATQLYERALAYTNDSSRVFFFIPKFPTLKTGRSTSAAKDGETDWLWNWDWIDLCSVSTPVEGTTSL